MIEKNRIYLDWNATAPLLPQVRQAMVDALDQCPGNASSIHHEGQVARAVVERARRAVARAVNAPMQSVILTGGATESNNLVIRHHLATHCNPYVVSSSVEHPSVLEVCSAISNEGYKTEVWPVDERGRLNLDWLKEKLDHGATFVSIMWANNEIGNIYPIHDIATMVHKAGAILHVDATQALGRIPVDFQDADIDYMTLSFHKMGGPKGIGAIVLREGLKVGAYLYGGHQERGRRPGTENIPAAAGLEAAAEQVRLNIENWHRQLVERRQYFIEMLNHNISGIEFRGDIDNQLPNTLNLAFDGINGEDLLLTLDLEGIAASSGSACTAGSLEPSHVVLALGYSAEKAAQSVRFSFGPATTKEMLADAVGRIGHVVERLRNL